MFGSTKSRHLAIRTFVAAALVFLGRLGPAWSDPPGPASGTAERGAPQIAATGVRRTGRTARRWSSRRSGTLDRRWLTRSPAFEELDPDQPVWVDKKHGQVILVRASCQASYALEFFTTLPGRDRGGHRGRCPAERRTRVLVVLGAEPGHPARFQPKYEPAEGTEVAIEVRWKDSQGKRQRAVHKTGSETSRPRRH